MKKRTEAEQFEMNMNTQAKKTDEFGLPLAPSKQVVDPKKLRTLFVAPPGFGKTEFFASNKDSLLLAAEEGHAFVECHKLILNSWDGDTRNDRKVDSNGNATMSFIEAANALSSTDRFPMVIIDTLDALVKMCTDSYVVGRNVEHISELGDYGKGYDIAQNAPIRRAIMEIFKSGRGVGMTTHQQINEHNIGKNKKGKKETSLPNGVIKFIYPMVEIVLHGEFGGQREGFQSRDRIVRTEGSEEILAKNRGGMLPPAYIMEHDQSKRWTQFESFFIDPKAKDAAYAEYLEFYEPKTK